MRYLFSYIICIALFASCGETDSAAPGDKQATSIQWIDSAVDYGRIQEGQKLAISFKFKNAGNSPLIIESVTPACGCTVADFPKEPIAPGKEGAITGEFDSNGREGLQHKELSVKANTAPGEQHIFFNVNVVKKAASTNNQ